MSHRNFYARLGSVALVLAAAAHPAAGARDLVVQAERLATRIVLLTRAELTSREHSDSIRRNLYTAAREVCQEQYPRSLYVFAHACTSGSFRDALGQVRQLQVTNNARSSGIEQVAILVRSK